MSIKPYKWPNKLTKRYNGIQYCLIVQQTYSILTYIHGNTVHTHACTHTHAHTHTNTHIQTHTNTHTNTHKHTHTHTHTLRHTCVQMHTLTSHWLLCETTKIWQQSFWSLTTFLSCQSLFLQYQIPSTSPKWLY